MQKQKQKRNQKQKNESKLGTKLYAKCGANVEAKLSSKWDTNCGTNVEAKLDAKQESKHGALVDVIVGAKREEIFIFRRKTSVISSATLGSTLGANLGTTLSTKIGANPSIKVDEKIVILFKCGVSLDLALGDQTQLEKKYIKVGTKIGTNVLFCCSVWCL